MIRKGDVYSADLGTSVGSEQSGKSKVVIIQNNTANKCSPTVIIAVLSNIRKKLYIPVHVDVTIKSDSRSAKATALLEQVFTVDKKRLIKYIGRLDDMSIHAINSALIVSLDLPRDILEL